MGWRKECVLDTHTQYPSRQEKVWKEEEEVLEKSISVMDIDLLGTLVVWVLVVLGSLR